MRLNKPSYGVFMVDIFASSVGIFILVSLLYIIESAKATSDEVMAEKFKTLVKRDKIPVDRYALPANRDPLHDWGIRARHAREKEEALILLLRDKVLLYHTMQTLDKDEIVDSPAINEYYQKYNKNRRLILEIHYHDAYHSLKAKIHESLPPDVHLWIHWAYNAGNITNPNPVLSRDNTHLVNMAGNQPQVATEEQGGMPSSISNGKSGQGTDAFGRQDAQAQSAQPPSGQGASTQGVEGQPNATQNQTQGQNSTSAEQQSPIQGSDIDSATQQQLQLQLEIEKQMQANASAEQFIDTFLPPIDPAEPTENPTQSAAPQQHSASQQGSETATGQHNLNNAANQTQNANSDNKKQPPQPQPQQQQEKTEAPDPQSQAAEQVIKKNVFVSIPLFSPINQFQLDVQVPGFEHKRYNLNAMAFRLRLTPQENADSIALSLEHGDAITPKSFDEDNGWIKVEIHQASAPNQPLSGWLYGTIRRQILMLPLLENQVQSISSHNRRYWFKTNTQALEQLNTEAEENGQ